MCCLGRARWWDTRQMHQLFCYSDVLLLLAYCVGSLSVYISVVSFVVGKAGRWFACQLSPRHTRLTVSLRVSVVAQAYEAEVGNEYVIRGNSAVLKCGIPSFVADFVHVTGWLEETTAQNFHHEPNFGT